MTVRQVYEAVLVELNKVKASHLLLGDFNYFLMKAIYNHMNNEYAVYDTTQLTTDTSRVLSYPYEIIPVDNKGTLPNDYFHILNCVCEFSRTSYNECDEDSNTVLYGARRLTADMFPQILNNYYFKPTYKRPYYYIQGSYSDNKPVDMELEYKVGVISIQDFPVQYSVGDRTVSGVVDLTLLKESITSTSFIVTGVFNYLKDKKTENFQVSGTASLANKDIYLLNLTVYPGNGEYKIHTGLNIQQYSNFNRDSVDKKLGYRYGNPVAPTIEFRVGKNKDYKLTKVYIDYLKTPQHVALTQQQLDSVEDYSQVMEFPEYVVFLIINELVKLIMENSGNPRLLTHTPINMTGVVQPQLDK